MFLNQSFLSRRYRHKVQRILARMQLQIFARFLSSLGCDFRDMTQCTLTNRCRRFGGMCCLYRQGFSCQITGCHIPEDSTIK
jgi:hypothetical protein